MPTSLKQTTRLSFRKQPTIFLIFSSPGIISTLEVKLVFMMAWISMHTPGFLIICIILVSHYSQSYTKQLGTNPVAVLATLLLVSYGKIIKAIIGPLSWTYLTYYNSTSESHHIVCFYDGSVDFFNEPKHIALGLFAIITLGSVCPSIRLSSLFWTLA